MDEFEKLKIHKNLLTIERVKNPVIEKSNIIACQLH